MRYEDIPWTLGGCVGTDAQTWFPEGWNPERDRTMISKVCGRCEIKPECLAWAIQNGEFGWWGGRYFSDREGMRGKDECVGAIHTGGDGNDVSGVWAGAPSEMRTDEREPGGYAGDPAAFIPAEIG